MNITLNPDQLTALTREAQEQSTKDNPLTAESLAANLLSRACDSYASRQADADNAALAQNTALLELGQAVNAASPEKQTAIMKAAQDILSAP